MSTRHSRLGGRSREDGAVIVEFVLVAIFVLIPILAGVIQFGISYSQYQLLQGAAREGARCAAVQATGYSDCDWQAAVENAAGPYELTNPPSVSVNGSPGVCTEETIGDNVTVSWEQNFDLGFLKFMPAVPDSVSGTISGTFRCE